MFCTFRNGWNNNNSKLNHKNKYYEKIIISLLFVISSCSSPEEEELLRQKLSQLTANEDMFWKKLDPKSVYQNSECVYKWFQNGVVYSVLCSRDWEDRCRYKKWYQQIPLDEITIVKETERQIVLIYKNRTIEVNYNEPNIVSLKESGEGAPLPIGNGGLDGFKTSKITASKIIEYEEWLTRQCD
jgi:hypothetical protein